MKIFKIQWENCSFANDVVICRTLAERIECLNILDKDKAFFDDHTE